MLDMGFIHDIQTIVAAPEKKELLINILNGPDMDKVIVLPEPSTARIESLSNSSNPIFLLRPFMAIYPKAPAKEPSNVLLRVRFGF